jgi:CxxC motif-containing protein
VRSRGEIPKGLLADVARAVSQAVVEAPIVIGQVIIADVCGSGVDITASRSLGRRP